MELEEYLEKLSAIRDGLDEKIAEANGLRKDIEHLVKEQRAENLKAEKILEEFREAVDTLVLKTMKSEMVKKIKEGLREYDKSLRNAIEEASDRVEKRFDVLVNVILGEETDTESLPELFRRRSIAKSRSNRFDPTSPNPYSNKRKR